MNVYVATRNPVKLRAVRTAFVGWFPTEPVDVRAVEPVGSLPEQPLEEEVVRGAIARAERAIAARGADWGVGIEAGPIRLPGSDRWVNTQVCAIAGSDGRIGVGLGPGFELPERVREAVLVRTSLREALRSVCSVDDKARRGAVHHLSGGRIDRHEITVAAVRMALVATGRG